MCTKEGTISARGCHSLALSEEVVVGDQLAVATSIGRATCAALIPEVLLVQEHLLLELVLLELSGLSGDPLPFPVELGRVVIVDVFALGLSSLAFVGIDVHPSGLCVSHVGVRTTAVIVMAPERHASTTSPAKSTPSTEVTAPSVAPEVISASSEVWALATTLSTPAGLLLARAGGEGLGVGIPCALELVKEAFTGLFLEEVAVKALSQTVLVLVLDVLEHEVGCAECLLADHADVLLVRDHFPRLVNTVLVFHLDKKFVLAGVRDFVLQAVFDEFFGLINVVLLELLRRAIESR